MQITLTIPDQIYYHLEQSALQQQQSLDEFLNLLVVEGMGSRVGTRCIWEWIAQQYQQRLANENKLTQTSTDILEDLQTIRENVANEIYPE